MSKHWQPDNVVRGRFGRTARRRSPPYRNYRSRKRSSSLSSWVTVGLLILVGVTQFGGAGDFKVASLPSFTASSSDASVPVRASFGFCHTGGGTNCVVDGDTIWLEGQNIRIADIDTPETHDSRCAQEQALGDRATVRLRQLLNSGAVTLQAIDRDTDSFGRKLRIVEVDGSSVGDTLVGEGLARRYEGGRRPWC
jgi:endonuclease YncB( thermonuclease family)